jgi:hypothetical protein
MSRKPGGAACEMTGTTLYVLYMILEMTDEQTEALIRELSQIIDNDRYPFSPRIRTLKEIRAKIRPEPAREPLPPVRHYEPPSKGRYNRRRG